MGQDATPETHDAETPRDAESAKAPYPWLNTALGTAAALLLGAISVLLVIQFLASRELDFRGTTSDLGETLTRTLRNQGIPESAIRIQARQMHRRDGAVYFFTRMEVDVPATVNAQGLESVVERSLWPERVVISGVESDAAVRTLHLALGPAAVGEIVLRGVSGKSSMDQEAASAGGPPALRVEPQPLARVSKPVPELREWTPPLSDSNADAAARVTTAQRVARVAIIVDDGGYGGAHTDTILGLDRALTLSILPYTPYGTELAQRAAALGFEVMLHMPMENLSDTLRHEGQLNVGMAGDEIAKLTQTALAQVPGAVGVNNHMGSKYTAEAEAMRPFLDWVKSSGLYFVDSGTTAKSIAYQAAHELGIPSASRTLFLDHVDDPEQIRARFLELAELARQQGEAIGICHFRPNTAAVLVEMLPQLKTMGVQLVPASELVR